MYEHSARKPSSVIVVSGEHDEMLDCVQCGHCGRHWQVMKGSGKTRGFCMKCMKPTCGNKECNDECMPFEKRIELYEKGKIKVL